MMLIRSIVERRSHMIDYLLRHSNWFNTLNSGRGRLRQEYMDEESIEEGKKYVSTERKKLQMRR